jgi:hypothetical protein
MLQIWGRQQTKVDAEKHKQTEKAVNSKLATKVAATTAVAAFVCAHMASAWVNGELSIWMDADRVAAVQQLGRQFEHDFGIKVHADATENIPKNFPLAAQSGKAPDIVIFAHDKVADGGSSQSVAGGSARSSRHLSGVHCFGFGAAGKVIGRHDCAGFLPGRVAKQRSSPRPRALYWRGVVNWQHVVDLDDSGGSEFSVVG